MIDAPKSDDELVKLKRQRSRNWAVFLALFGFVVLVFAITIVKIRMSYGS